MRVWYNKANSSTRDAWKIRAREQTITWKEYSTNISEEYEYSYEKVERVSLPHKRMLGSIFIQRMKITKTKPNRRFKIST